MSLAQLENKSIENTSVLCQEKEAQNKGGKHTPKPSLFQRPN